MRKPSTPLAAPELRSKPSRPRIANPNSSIFFPYSKTHNRPLFFVPKPIWVQKPELSFFGGNGGGGAGVGGNSKGWNQGGDGNSDDSSSSVSGFRVLGMFLNRWISQVAVDPQFAFKVLMEEVVGVSSCVLSDMVSRPNFGLNELNFIFSTLVIGCILNFILNIVILSIISRYVNDN
ncbi:hypothetical protein ACFX13_038081 [Malus domestica]|uniref:protein RETICULATA-RELATED 3, chloroplastic-like n=1 Tax=Malus domestica TaxID=3750 RepID=UPI0039765ECC